MKKTNDKLTKFAEEVLKGIYEDYLKEVDTSKFPILDTQYLLTNHLDLNEGEWYKEHCPITRENYHKVNWKYLENKYKFFVSSPVKFEEYK